MITASLSSSGICSSSECAHERLERATTGDNKLGRRYVSTPEQKGIRLLFSDPQPLLTNNFVNDGYAEKRCAQLQQSFT
jgi:hypothetical protein